jgi:hypothetical protein
MYSTIHNVNFRTDGLEVEPQTLDQIPGEAVMEAKKDLVSVEHTLKQVTCVKG